VAALAHQPSGVAHADLKTCQELEFRCYRRGDPCQSDLPRITRVRDGKVPDAKVLVRARKALGPEVVKQIHARCVEIAKREEGDRGPQNAG